MPKGAEEYLLSCGLKNALYSIRAADLTDEIFGTLVPCTFQVRDITSYVNNCNNPFPVFSKCIYLLI